ncbi:MAG: NTP transferase domain-containing protein [Candidatus Omnitrophota bacterium]|nr:NTP transferase domain-containing protein [Candidatus Omnitrophota bacterium]
MENITAVILAAGLGIRMKTDVPKVLHRIGSKTMLGRIIANLKKSGVTDIIAVVGHKADIVESFFKEAIRFVRQPELLGSGDALAHAVDYMEEDGDVLVTCGDTPLISDDTYAKLVERHIREKASCTLLTSTIADPASYGRIIRDRRGNVLRIVEEKDLSGAEKEVTEINVGTYCFRKDNLKKFVRNIKINEKKKEFYLTDMIDILVRNGKRIVSETCEAEEAVGVNSRKDLADMNRIINRKNVEKLMDSGVTVIDPDTTYIDETAEIGRDTIIFPCTVIESDIRIAEGCKVGPFARLRPGTSLSRGVEVGNYVELCRTEIGERTKVKHHAYLGDTVVGRDVNIGAGTITANYDGKNKYRTEIGDNAFIGVGAVLIAPVRIGKGAVVGAGSVITKNKDVPAGETVIGVPARPLSTGGR